MTTAFTPHAKNHAHLGPKASRVVQANDMAWEPIAYPGCFVKTLMLDRESGLLTVLLKMEPGAELPDHEHMLVEQTFSGPASVNGAILKATVVENVLSGGNHVDWVLQINGVSVGRFRVNQGFTGTMTVAKSFAAITGPTYDIAIRVINEVPAGGGSITLTYAGSAPHGIVLRSA